MSAIDQGRPLAMTAPAGMDFLLPIDFRGREALSELFRFELTFLARRADRVAFEKLIGQPIAVSVRLADERVRWFHGIVERLTEGEHDAEFREFRAVLVPEWWRRTRNRNCRIFQHQSIPDILKAVLAGTRVEFRLERGYAPRNYCVQFLESDFHFASRLMEEEGIYYYFEHSEKEHVLVIADTSSDAPVADGPASVRFDRDPAGTRGECMVTLWKKTQSMSPGKHTAKDYCFEMPDHHVETTAMVMEKVQVGQVNHDLHAGSNGSIEVFQYPDGSAQHHDNGSGSSNSQAMDMSGVYEENRFRARLHAEREAVQSVAIEGTSTCGQFLPGRRFTLARHGDGDGDYVLTDVRFEASLSGYRSGETPALEYHNRFACIPRALPFRPALRTHRTNIPGVQTATVVGIAGEEVFTDAHGRVKVQFHWDREGKRDENSSCWVRVGQAHAGSSFGALHIPRIGQEVLVAFHMGNPDVPYVVGSVYNGDCKPPFDLPSERHMSGFRSHTFGGSAAQFNGVAFSDQAGQEKLQVNAQKNYNLDVKGMAMEKVEGMKTEIVLGGNFVVNAGTYDRATAGLDSRIALVGDLHSVFGVSTNIVTGLGLDTMIGKRVEVTIAPILAHAVTEHVYGNRGAWIYGENETHVRGNSEYTVTGGVGLDLDGNPEQGNHKLTVKHDLDVKTGRYGTIEGGEKLVLIVPFADMGEHAASQKSSNLVVQQTSAKIESKSGKAERSTFMLTPYDCNIATPNAGLVLSEESAEVSAFPPDDPESGCKVKVTQTEIELTTPQCSITLGPNGIAFRGTNIKVTGDNKVSITAVSYSNKSAKEELI